MVSSEYMVRTHRVGEASVYFRETERLVGVVRKIEHPVQDRDRQVHTVTRWKAIYEHELCEVGRTMPLFKTREEAANWLMNNDTMRWFKQN